MKYHIKNDISKKELRKHGLKPLPLMKADNNEPKRNRPNTDGVRLDIERDKDIERTEG